jgi:nucleolar protein 6
MSEQTHKKRKRSAKDPTDETHPRKSRIVETADETTPAVPEEPSITVPPVSTGKTLGDGSSRQEKSERRSKKGKKSTDRAPKEPLKGSLPATTNDALVTSEDFVSITDSAIAAEPAAKRQKKSKAPKPVQTPDSGPVSDAPNPNPSTKPARFIVFVGNLPFTATKEQILAHFAKITPSSIRHSTNKATGRSKGFAFLEFDGYDKMKTCLKLYHHSIFDPDASEDRNDGKGEEKKASTAKGRKINVELTVGGGGMGKGRKEKLKGKNQRLEEQRERLRAKEKEEKEKEHKKQVKKAGPQVSDANATIVQQDENGLDARGAIHPSRLNRVAR